jgi:hypothetical protein
MSQEQAEKVAAEHGASIKLYAYKHQH